ncbi:MAG: DUF3298 domain-containing protein [Clostridia bacterium]|nr:DUF3298 domain-containing protein [Clostridia bacterium]
MKRWMLMCLMVLILVGCKETPVTNEKPVEDIEEEIIEEFILIPNYIVEDFSYFWGFSDVNHMDDFILEPVYDKVYPFNEDDLAVVIRNGRYAMIKSNGDIVVDFGVYDLITTYKNYFIASKGDSVDLIRQDKIIGNFENLYNGSVYYNHYFVQGETIRVLDEKTDQLIDLGSSEDYTVNELTMKNYGQDIQLNYDEISNKYYYTKDDVKIGDAYDYAEPFENGYAIVGNQMTGEYDYLYIFEYALMDSHGQLVLPMNHASLKYLGQGYYAYSKTSSFSEDDMYILPYAQHAYKQGIYKGTEKLTDEKYYSLECIEDDLLYVFDGSDYYFITEKEQRIHPKINITGDYSFHSVGEIIVGEFKNTYVYFHGEQWILDDYLTKFPNGYITQVVESRGTTTVSYPKLHYIDQDVADAINYAIHSKFSLDHVLNEEIYYETNDTEAQLIIDGNLAIVDGLYFSYGFGAAHGNYAEDTEHYNLTTGKLLTLEDLFVEDPYDIIPVLLATYEHEDPYFYVDLNEMSLEEKIEFFTMPVYNFKVTGNTLNIYFNPYEIAPYAAGIISFKFDITNLEGIDYEGPFFK